MRSSTERREEEEEEERGCRRKRRRPLRLHMPVSDCLWVKGSNHGFSLNLSHQTSLPSILYI